MSRTRYNICERKNCFAYNIKRAHNCACLTEALDPCPFYKSLKEHNKQCAQIRAMQKKKWGVING